MLKELKELKDWQARLAQPEPKVCKVPLALQVLLVLRVPKVSKEMRGLKAQLVPKDFKDSKVPQALQDRPGQPVLQASWALLVQQVPKAQLVLHLR